MAKSKDVKRRLYKRRFLNKTEGIALLVTECEYTLEQHGPYFSASATVGDCSRQVTLDFSLYNDKDNPDSDGTVESRLAKINTVIHDLLELREKIQTWGTEYVAKDEEWRKTRAAKGKKTKTSVLDLL